MQTKRRLTAMETRAQQYGKRIRQGITTVIVLNRSRAGGCSILDNGGRLVARASGCGYDKEAAVLADLLRWVGETDAERSAIWRCEGVPELTRVLRSYGWVLQSLGGPARQESYAIRRPYQDETID
jgi:hypothetical protein